MRRIPFLALIGSMVLFLAACAGRPNTTGHVVYYPITHVVVMESYPGVYYHEGYRDSWTRTPVGPWRPVRNHRLPPRRRKKVNGSGER